MDKKFVSLFFVAFLNLRAMDDRLGERKKQIPPLEFVKQGQRPPEDCFIKGDGTTKPQNSGPKQKLSHYIIWSTNKESNLHTDPFSKKS